MQCKLTEINIYPIKSCAGTSLTHAQLGATGLEYDRRWMMADAAGQFMTQRKHPQMALIKPCLINDHGKTLLRLSAPGMDDFQFQPQANGEKVNVIVWDDQCRAVDQGKDVADWLCRYMKTSCRLVAMDRGFVRPVDERYRTSPTDQISFADGYPLLLISQASLDDLNKRLAEPVLMNRFRPNLVVAGCSAFKEDTWKTITIGTIEFAVVKPCDRCVITTIDQANGKGGLEPLKTLATYRLVNNKIMFGQNLIHRNTGMLSLGDLVKINNLQLPY